VVEAEIDPRATEDAVPEEPAMENQAGESDTERERASWSPASLSKQTHPDERGRGEVTESGDIGKEGMSHTFDIMELGKAWVWSGGVVISSDNSLALYSQAVL
jgi:hypothetical protein